VCFLVGPLCEFLHNIQIANWGGGGVGGGVMGGTDPLSRCWGPNTALCTLSRVNNCLLGTVNDAAYMKYTLIFHET
jgi:hypothetical protein